MEDEDYPTTPYSADEQRRILRDFEESKRQAFEDGDELKLSYLIYG